MLAQVPINIIMAEIVKMLQTNDELRYCPSEETLRTYFRTMGLFLYIDKMLSN